MRLAKLISARSSHKSTWPRPMPASRSFTQAEGPLTGLAASRRTRRTTAFYALEKRPPCGSQSALKALYLVASLLPRGQPLDPGQALKMARKKKRPDSFYVEKKQAKGRVRSCQFNIRMTPSERAELQAYIEQSNKSAPDYILELARGATVIPVASDDLVAELHKLRTELLRQGNNLNQIAFRINRAAKTRLTDELDDAAASVCELQCAQTDLCRDIERVLKKVA